MAAERIAIVGAGIMGRVLALRLLATAHTLSHPVSLSLFDRDSKHSGSAAAYTAAGMLAPYSEVETTERLVFDMGCQALQLWPPLAATLPQPIGFQQPGSLVVAHRNDRADYQRFLQQLQHKPECSSAMQQWHNGQISKACPQLADNFNEAIYIAAEAAVDSGAFMQASTQALVTAGVHWHEQAAVRAICQRDGQARLQANGSSHSFDRIIDCRGLGAKDSFSDLRGVRGELIWLQAPEVNIKQLVRLIHPRYRLYLVPRANNVYLLGATQLESEDRGEITVRSALELLSAAYSLSSSFAEARVVKTVTNLRPALRDNLPRIFCNQRLLHINGLFRHGYLLSPVLADIACNHLFNTGAETPFDDQIIQ